MISLIGLLFFVDQSSFSRIGVGYGLAFLSYYWISVQKDTPLGVNTLILLAVVIRAIAIFAFPNLSDDIYRFAWDGRLAIQGYHPFEHLPSYFLEEGNTVEGLTSELYDQLNSKDYFTIYPTLSQWVFALSAWLFPDSLYGFSCVMKGILTMMDIGSIFLMLGILKHMNMDKKHVLLYALNPLVIIEISGNGHFEGGMIFFFVLAAYWFMKHRLFLSAVALSASVASKMLPLMFLPLLLACGPWRKILRYYVFTAIGLMLFAAPLLSQTLIEHLSQSLNLYFQKFEFNASIYYIIRWIGFQIKGWNMIAYVGPILGIVVFIAVWCLTFFNRNTKPSSWPRLVMWCLTIYFGLATIVHPWYITTLVAVSIFSQYRFPILWSGLITMTYINYSYSPYFENLWFVALEYLLVFTMLIFEIKKYNFTKGDLVVN